MPTTLLTEPQLTRPSVENRPDRNRAGQTDPAPTRRLRTLTAVVPPVERPRAPLSPAGLAVARGSSRVRACSGTTARGSVPVRSRPGSAAAAPARGVLRLTRRGRVVVVLLALAVCAVLFSLGRHSAGAAVRTHPPLATTAVQSGESLWSIAARVAPSADPRDEIERIARTNGLSDDAVLTPGQVLRIPA